MKSLAPFTLRLALSILAIPCVLFAQTTVWNGGNSGSWDVPGNWTLGVPVTGGTASFTNNPADAPVTITVTEGAVANQLSFNFSGNRSYTFSGETLTFIGSTARILTSTSSVGAITINNNLFYTNDTLENPITFTLGGTQTGTSRFSSLTINGDILTDAAGEGVGARQIGIVTHSSALITINGKVEASHTVFAGDGEVVANNLYALGTRGAVQKTSSSTLSLRSDLTVTGGTNTYSWTNGIHTTFIRISAITPDNTDRVITLEKRMAGSTGGFTWIDNINSTGKLILELQYSGGTVQAGNLATNESAIVRFAQTGNTTYSGAMSGAGELQITGGGNATFSGANTYTGNTLINAGTFTLSSTGSLNFLIGENGENTQITGTALGNLVLNGQLTFDLSGASLNPGDSWLLIDMDSLGNVTYGLTFSIKDFTKNENIWSFGQYQFDQTTGVLTAIPEPSLAMLFSGLLGLGVLLMRRKSA